MLKMDDMASSNTYAGARSNWRSKLRFLVNNTDDNGRHIGDEHLLLGVIEKKKMKRVMLSPRLLHEQTSNNQKIKIKY